jgi:formylglycine-generating enzyme required for sulfatase activity
MERFSGRCQGGSTLLRLWLSSVFLMFLLVPAVHGHEYEPFTDRRIVNGSQGMYAVVHLADPTQTAGFGAVRVIIAERTPESGPVEPQIAEWRPSSAELGGDGGDALSQIVVASVGVDEGDAILGNFPLPRPPKRILFGNSTKVVVSIDAFGPFDESSPLVTIHSVRGDLLQQVTRHDMFSDLETSRMLNGPSSEMAWIDEVAREVITVTRAHAFIDEWIVNTVSIDTGIVQRVAPDALRKSLRAENAVALYDVMSAVEALKVPVSSSDLGELLRDEMLPRSGRMMAAVLLAKANGLKNREFVEEQLSRLQDRCREKGFEREFALFNSIGPALGYCRRCDEILTYRALVTFLPTLLGDNASPFLWTMMEQDDSAIESLAVMALAIRGRAVVPEATATLGDKKPLEARMAAARLLAAIGPPARDSLPLLRNLEQHGDEQLRKAAEEAIARIDRVTIDVESPPVALRSFTNSIGMEFRLIPLGEFTMGGLKSSEDVAPHTAGEYALDERPPHPVRITKPFWMAVTEVTQEQYLKVTGDDPSEIKGAFHPVERVDWADAVEFCKRLSAIESREYRLPTEAEWEYACRAGTSTDWCCDDDGKDLEEYGWYIPGSTWTHPVGQKKPNRWGLYDVHGNVAEWCNDWAGKYTDAPQRDPTGPCAGSARIVRGGHIAGLVPMSCRSPGRQQFPPTSRELVLGFRIVMVDEPGREERVTGESSVHR